MNHYLTQGWYNEDNHNHNQGWHNTNGQDNLASLDFKRISDLNKILRVFIAEYLHLQQQ